jgi:hypothetical protein
MADQDAAHHNGHDPETNEELAKITPIVLRVLAKRGFFAKLDDYMCPAEEFEPYVCQHDFALSTQVLSDMGFDDTERRDVLAVLVHSDARCDCEVLFNISASNRLKAQYWKDRTPKSIQ